MGGKKLLLFSMPPPPPPSSNPTHNELKRVKEINKANREGWGGGLTSKHDRFTRIMCVLTKCPEISTRFGPFSGGGGVNPLSPTFM